MIDRSEFRAQAARLQLSNADIANITGVSANTVRAFMKGADARISVLCKILEALGGEVAFTFKKVSDRTLSQQSDLGADRPAINSTQSHR